MIPRPGCTCTIEHKFDIGMRGAYRHLTRCEPCRAWAAQEPRPAQDYHLDLMDEAAPWSYKPISQRELGRPWGANQGNK